MLFYFILIFIFIFFINLGIVGALILKLFKNPELKVTTNKIKGPPNTGLNFKNSQILEI